MAVDRDSLDVDLWTEGINAFTQFINDRMDFAIAVYPEKEAMESFYPEAFGAIKKRRSAGGSKVGVFWENIKEDPESECNEQRIRMATEYIRENISRGISRAQVAERLHLNEEYFSRLFKKYTGYTFKDYDTLERINQAKKLLEYSRFSISIIASKVGYDNFSHFSKVFKKMTGQTPQEYRKSCEDAKHRSDM